MAVVSKALVLGLTRFALFVIYIGACAAAPFALIGYGVAIYRGDWQVAAVVSLCAWIAMAGLAFFAARHWREAQAKLDREYAREAAGAEPPEG